MRNKFACHPKYTYLRELISNIAAQARGCNKAHNNAKMRSRSFELRSKKGTNLGYELDKIKGLLAHENFGRLLR